MKIHTTKRIATHCVLLGTLISASACEMEEEEFDEQISTSESSLLGDVITGDDCTSSERQLLKTSMQYGRIAAASTAFEECVADVLSNAVPGTGGPYLECNGDPYHGYALETQLDRVLRVARSRSDVAMTCTGGNGNASAFLGDYNAGPEEFNWGLWFREMQTRLNQPLCANNGNQQPCRYAPEPWPFSQIAGIAWHEVMHTNGYTHGANDQANARVACGQEDSNFYFQSNTMPYIIGNCIQKTIESTTTCSESISCGRNELLLPDSRGSSTCSCAQDPGKNGIGLIDVQDGDFRVVEQVDTDEWMGGWNLNTDAVSTFGDFDGDGKDEYIIQHPWGIGLIGMNSSGKMVLQRAVRSGTRIGNWTYPATAAVEGVGDFNGDGRDDLILRTHNGIAVVGFSRNSGRFYLHSFRPFHNNFDGRALHPLDRIAGIGDFNGDGRDDLIVRGASGRIGVYRLRSGRLQSLRSWSAGSWVSGWNHRASDTIEGVGDFTGNGRIEFIIRSSWGYAIIGGRNSGAFRLIDTHRFGSVIPRQYSGSSPWTTSASDSVLAIADLNDDGKKDIVLRSSTSVGILSIGYTGTLRVRKSYPIGSAVSGGWRWGRRDQIVAVGNFDGLYGEDLLVQNNWGIGLLTMRNTNTVVYSPTLSQRGTGMGVWFHTEADRVEGGSRSNHHLGVSGDMNGDGTDEFMIQRYVDRNIRF